MRFRKAKAKRRLLASLVLALNWTLPSVHTFSIPQQSCSQSHRVPASSNRALPFLPMDSRPSACLNGLEASSSHEADGKSENKSSFSTRMDRNAWLKTATQSLLDTKQYPHGSLNHGKWHELTSMMNAWSKAMRDPGMKNEAPLVIESLLKRIIDEQRAGNNEAHPSTELYNMAIDAWAASCMRRRQSKRQSAAAVQRAQEILLVMQNTYQAENNTNCRPNEHSFFAVLQALSKQRGQAKNAKSMLLWMEDLYKTGKNPEAKPTLSTGIVVLDALASSGHEDAGRQAEKLLSHMKALGIQPNTLCYNIVIKAWSKARRGRASAEHAERLLHETPEPDVVTYSSVIHAWATSGMRTQAAERAEEILRRMEASPNVVTYNAVLNAWCKSGSSLAMQRMEALLHKMEQEHQRGQMRDGPDLISYNTYIHILSNRAKDPGMAQRADDVLARLEEKYDAGEISFSPNLFSYNLVIEAWSKSRDRHSALRAIAVFQRLAKREGIEADNFSYNQVIAALSRSGLPGSAQKAEELLEYMEATFDAGSSTAKPDMIGYTSAIVAWSRTREPGSVQRAERLLDRMNDRYKSTGDENMKPNSVSFNAVIDAWARSREGILGARKAESLVTRMMTAHKAGDDNMQPNIFTYNALMNAWARSGTRCCARKAERILDLMWSLYNDGKSNVKPDGMTYNTVINAISKSKNEGKGQKALRILRRMDKLYQAGDKDTRPNEFTYTSVLNSCAYCTVEDQRSRLKALDTAIFTLEELQGSQYGDPNHVTYGTFLKACANLLPSENKQMRRMVVGRAFTQCRRDGQVGEMVLSHLTDAIATDAFLYDVLLGGVVRQGTKVRIQDLPAEWSCNVRERKRWSRAPHARRVARHRQPRNTSGLGP